MPDVTPAQLSLELNVGQKSIRGFLRQQFGKLPPGETRWTLTDEQASLVRANFSSEGALDERKWTLEIGDTVARRELHSAFGGSRQNGIVTLKSIPDILAFTSRQSGAPFGYDTFEGLREDGSYSYTGEGQTGDQVFTRGNRALRDSGPEQRPIRLFTVTGTAATYVGEFTTGTPTCKTETIGDAQGNPRTGIIFNLIPIDADMSLLQYPTSITVTRSTVTAWSSPEASDIVVVQNDPHFDDDRVVSRVEFALQAQFGAWLKEHGLDPSRLRLETDGVTIEPDFFVESRGWIVEAKKSSARGYVRTAIGQVLDYVHVARIAGHTAVPVILLPGRPNFSLLSLMHHLDITVIVRTSQEFEVMTPNHSSL